MRLTRILGAALCLPALLLALTAAGAQAQETTVMGWGLNRDGQIGTGSVSNMGCFCIATAQPVVGVAGVTQVAAGREHTLALLSNGTVMAWGANERGQLGDGTRTNRLSPIQVPGLSNVVAVAAGELGSLALMADGTVKSWGDNSNGELGVGDEKGPETCTEMLAGMEFSFPCSLRPVTVPGLASVVAISVGGAYDLALRADGAIFAWGYDNGGALGNGMSISAGCACLATPTLVPGVSGAMAIYAGEEVASALLADGTVVDWGRNDAGGLGNGNTDVASSQCSCLGPVHVRNLTGASGIAAGGAFGLASLADGGAVSWGFNRNGELGNGTATAKTANPCECLSSPGAIQLLGRLTLAAGEHHGLALSADGVVASWGGNRQGQLGIGVADETPHPSPATLPLTGVSAIAAGAEDSFALIGPTHALSVKFAGAGKGTVGGSGMLCTSDCAGRFPDRQVAILRAEGTGTNGFAGFTDGCTGAKSCQVSLDADKTVTATFGVPKGTRIARARINRRRGTATFSSTAPGAIKGFQCLLIKPRAQGKAHRKAKRHKPRFARCAAKKAYRRLPPGRYTFKVRAFDIIGIDAHPAVRHFRIAAKRSARRATG